MAMFTDGRDLADRIKELVRDLVGLSKKGQTGGGERDTLQNLDEYSDLF